MAALNNFDTIAAYYDRLKRAIFGSAIRESQLCYLERLPAAANVLLLGGGTGEVIGPLLKTGPQRRIWYVEASARMLQLAQKATPECFRDSVIFIHGTENTLPGDVVFDVIVTNFFLDLFPDEALSDLAGKLHAKMGTNGFWIATDFVNGGKIWQRILLYTMYKFFLYMCRIDARKLPSWEEQLTRQGLVQKHSQLFYGGFIKACLYVKSRNVFSFLAGP